MDGITINVSSITGHIDDANSNVAAAIVFPLTYQDGASALSVHMHLHHTTRCIQLQVSSLIYGKTRAPVWFVDHVVNGIFYHFANSKSVDIGAFNSKVPEMLSKLRNKLSTQEKYKACNSQFDGRSMPELCQSCNFKYHKKCYQGYPHSCRHNGLSGVHQSIEPQPVGRSATAVRTSIVRSTGQSSSHDVTTAHTTPTANNTSNNLTMATQQTPTTEAAASTSTSNTVSTALSNTQCPGSFICCQHYPSNTAKKYRGFF